ncbi:DUF349 domain-containing protein [Falsiporphyromonas endometrii]|uniref:DUF349 domain-containing protein n=1 Tax=Falsiporphyromonas endometrii TaxID=1387297 RepID=A0ABV9K6C6_9PORP
MEMTTNSHIEPQDDGLDREQYYMNQSGSSQEPDLSNKNAAELVEALAVLLQRDPFPTRQEVDVYKKAFYRRKVYVENKIQKEGAEFKEDINDKIEVHEERLKDLLSSFKDKSQKIREEEEAKKEANLEKKQALIEQLKKLLVCTDEFGKIIVEFRQLRENWDATGDVPDNVADELQSTYSKYVEQFYDLKQINEEFREYDFKKNLESKTALCEEAEALSESDDVIGAARQLQTLHRQWKEIGPVARDLRDSIWARFKEASSKVNKRHQEFFEKIKAKEEENLEKKKSLCERIEAINTDNLKQPGDWKKATTLIIDTQKEWKTVGFAPKKENEKIYLRFRAACDAYFANKSTFFSRRRSELDQNYIKKQAMVDEAESLQDSTDWKVTADRLIKLQKDWKEVGPVHRKYNQTLWDRFRSACDKFFERKKENFSQGQGEFKENLKAKKEIIAKLEALMNEEDENIAREQLSSLMSQFRSIGFVPYKEKDNIKEAFRKASDDLYNKLKLDRNHRKLDNYSESLKEIADSSKNALFRERDRIGRILDRMKQELHTYEHNLSCFTVDSKGGNKLVDDMKRKKKRLEEDIKLTKEKLKLIKVEINSSDNED